MLVDQLPLRMRSSICWAVGFLGLLTLWLSSATAQTTTPQPNGSPTAPAETDPPVEPSPPVAASPEQVADFFRSVYGSELPPEGARMLQAIVSGSQMGPGEGWFGPGQTRYDFSWLAQQCGLPTDAPGIPRQAFPGTDPAFLCLDRNRDGTIQRTDLDWSEDNPYVEMLYSVNRMFRRIDSKGSGALTKEEWMNFFERASTDQERLTAEDFSGAVLAGYTGSFARGDGPDVATLIRGLFAGEIGSMLEGPKLSQKAPWFELRKVRGEGSIALSDLIGEKPVVLVFGNFTCGPFRSFYPAVDALYRKYEGQANFVMVYVREAHPANGWKMESNTRAGVDVAQPTTLSERTDVAQQFCTRLNPSMPVVVDELSDPVGHAYSGMPARLYVIDRAGKIAFKSGRGPFGFKPPELEQALVLALLEKPSTQTVSRADQESLWQLLPETTFRSSQQLPNWVASMAPALPRTAAAMLRLDYAHRVHSPLDPTLRAKMRWMIADANRCPYAQETAIADLKRAGASDEAIHSLRSGILPDAGPEADALRFARELTVDAPGISDELFERLRNHYGDKQVAAMVLLAAYGNFQDRILLGLQVNLEPDGPLPPLQVDFVADAFQTRPILPESKPAPALVADGRDIIEDDPLWGLAQYESLQQQWRSQPERRQRLPTPTWEVVAAQLPPEFNARPTKIVWNLVCMGYVPELAVPWSTTTRTMWAELPQDRVFEESLFWVQTRTVQCRYCMGHCEMLLEVAGMSKEQVSDRIQALASDNWSAFPESEQRSYAFARKLTKTPWEITQHDWGQLEKDLGQRQAMATFFWLCRGLYMTRVSDGFRLELETENVFQDFAKQTQSK